MATPSSISRFHRPCLRRTGSFVICLTLLEVMATAAAAAPPRPKEASPSSARAPIRRMTRIEHEHTLRDLLALPGLDVRGLLPEDGRAHGFDKSASALDVSHVHVAGWVAAADAGLATATAWQVAAPKPVHETLLPGAQEFFKLALLEGDAVFLKNGAYDHEALPIVRSGLPHKLAHYEQSGLFPYRHSVGVFRRQAVDDHFALFFTRFSPVRAGRYRLRLSTWSFQWEKGRLLPRAAPESVSLHADDRLLGYVDAPSLEPTVHQFDTWLNPGERILFTAASLPPARVYQMPGRAAEYVGPGVAIDWLEVEGPLHESWPPESHRRLYGDLPLTALAGRAAAVATRPVARQLFPGAIPRSEEPGQPWAVTSADPATDARRLLTAFLTRAYRRPVAAGELAVATGLVARRMKQGEPLEGALKTAYQAALCSPEFLFLGAAPGRLDDWALASRLSYFLWDSMPDDELFSLARRKQLGRPEVLHAQVERMLADPRSSRFIEHFTDEWLDLGNLDTVTPDATLYPEFDRPLLDAMREESRAFVAELIRVDAPVTALVRSDFAMLNQRLARHYAPRDRLPGSAKEEGLEAVRGTTIRRVELPPGSHRGGLLGQAAVHTLTANGTVTSPVKRGAWVLRELLDEPPEPPPPNIPAVDPDVRGAVSIREQLARHTSDVGCASCHASIDPPGFALESFDAIGGWRDHYRLGVGDPAGPPGPLPPAPRGPVVDTSCTLPDGRACGGFEDFRDALVADPRRLSRALVRQLVVYATGSDVTPADRDAIERIIDEAGESGGGVRSLLHAVVNSPLFLEQ